MHEGLNSDLHEEGSTSFRLFFTLLPALYHVADR
jgi:hypothetical protein